MWDLYHHPPFHCQQIDEDDCAVNDWTLRSISHPHVSKSSWVWHLRVMALYRKDEGSYMTRTDDRSWAHWALLCCSSTNQLGFPSLVTEVVVTNALGMALTRCGWVPAVSQPARGTQDVVALRWGRSLEIYWWHGSAFWPGTSVRRAG